MAALSVKETKVYKLAFKLAMEIYEISKTFPKEETYSVKDQIRRSSRSVCICLLESYRKKDIPRILLLKSPIVMWQIQKLPVGLILRSPVNTLAK